MKVLRKREVMSASCEKSAIVARHFSLSNLFTDYLVCVLISRFVIAVRFRCIFFISIEIDASSLIKINLNYF